MRAFSFESSATQSQISKTAISAQAVRARPSQRKQPLDRHPSKPHWNGKFYFIGMDIFSAIPEKRVVRYAPWKDRGRTRWIVGRDLPKDRKKILRLSSFVARDTGVSYINRYKHNDIQQAWSRKAANTGNKVSSDTRIPYSTSENLFYTERTANTTGKKSRSPRMEGG